MIEKKDPNGDPVNRALIGLISCDAEGNPIEEAGSFFLSGYAHINKITEDEIRTLIAAFPYLTFDYDQLVDLIVGKFGRRN